MQIEKIVGSIMFYTENEDYLELMHNIKFELVKPRKIKEKFQYFVSKYDNCELHRCEKTDLR